MTSDITKTVDYRVTAIQGEAISTTTPSDGYVLTWNSSGDGYWEPKPSQATGLRKMYFTGDGYWTCPAGVTNIVIIGAGGGGGGAAGADQHYYGGAGGGGSIQQVQFASVIPNTVYSVTIGAGGFGGIGSTTLTSSSFGSDGYATSLTAGGINYFYSVGAGGGGSVSNSDNSFSGLPFSNAMLGWNTVLLPGSGGNSLIDGSLQSATQNWVGGYTGGIIGSNGYPGAGGGAGPQGNGGNGGDGDIGSNGTSAIANTGAGGGGGGDNSMAGSGGSGGNGGSGYMYIIF